MTKQRVAYRLDYAMWKVLEYARDPAPGILLGDSRMAALDAGAVSGASGRRFYNFAYGGGSLQEAIETFWIADGATELEEAVFGINFELYNERHRVARVTGARDVLRNPLLYFSSPEDATRYFLEGSRYPAGARRDLAAIADHCHRRGIALSLVIFPTHTDLQAKPAEYGLEAEVARFREDLRALGRTFDFDFPNELTRDAGRFLYPYHGDGGLRDLVVRTVWGGDRSRVRVN